MIRGLATCSLLAVVLAAGGCAGNQKSSAESGGKHDGGGDLLQLQGTWEQQPDEGRTASPQQRVVKQVNGNTETVTTDSPNGQVVHAQSAKVRLGRSGSVPIYTFYDRRITAGPEQGRGDDAGRSYVYRLRGDEFDEVWGLLPGQEQRELVIKRWRRTKP